MTVSTFPMHITQLFRTLRPLPVSHRLLTTSASRPSAKPTLPSIPSCPPESCACAAMPEGLDIDYKRSLKNTMPSYAQHVIIHTGRDDWGSRIEEDSSTTGFRNVAKELKQLVGKGGKLHDPSHPIMITNSSGGGPPDPDEQIVQLLPGDLMCCLHNEPGNSEYFAQKWLGAGKRQVHGGIGRPTILICGHKSRDSRCGILGPILEEEFWRQTEIKAGNWMGIAEDEFEAMDKSVLLPFAQVSLCSHVGGHAFAGNVIIHFPRLYSPRKDGIEFPLAGKSVWYGRVEPRHVEGIIDETIMGGKLIEDLLRGVNTFPDPPPMKGMEGMVEQDA